MAKFEIVDPQLRRVLVEKTGHVRLIHEYQYETAFEIFQYVKSRLNKQIACDDSVQPFLDYIERFFGYSVAEYDPKSPSYLDGLVLHMSSIFEDSVLNHVQKARLLIASGNLFEMNRILIDIANQIHRDSS